MEIGTRVEVKKELAETWGYTVPATGTVIGPDPDGDCPNIVAVKLDQGWSIFEAKGVNIGRLIVEEQPA